MAEAFALSFDVHGDQQLMRGFSRFAENIKDLTSPFEEIAKDFNEGEVKQFQSAGSYGAGGWAPLLPGTVERKARGGYSMDILVRSGALRDAMAGRGIGAVKEIRPLSMRVGTNLNYARFHQKGTTRMVARPVIMLPEEQKTRWHKIIHRFLVQSARRALS